MKPTRQIIWADSIHNYLPERKTDGAIFTSIPDASEIGVPLKDYEEWFGTAADLCFNYSGGRPSVFFQTDRKGQGVWLSKARWLMEWAERRKIRLLAHKIVLRRSVGATDLHRPGYSHLLMFGGDKVKPGKASPDVLQQGPTLYDNGIPFNAVLVGLNFIAKQALLPPMPVIDPFCGRGTIPYLAEAVGLNSIGVDIDESQVKLASAFAPHEVRAFILNNVKKDK